MKLTLTLFFVAWFFIVVSLSYCSMCIGAKKWVNPLNSEVISKLVLAGVTSVGIATVIICAFNLYLAYLHNR